MQAQKKYIYFLKDSCILLVCLALRQEQFLLHRLLTFVCILIVYRTTEPLEVFQSNKGFGEGSRLVQASDVAAVFCCLVCYYLRYNLGETLRLASWNIVICRDELGKEHIGDGGQVFLIHVIVVVKRPTTSLHSVSLAAGLC